MAFLKSTDKDPESVLDYDLTFAEKDLLMSEQNEETRTYTKEELEAMTPEAANNLMMIATKIEGTGIVRRADGSIKYDDPELKGTYSE
jgi:hypothetical protein